MKAVAELLGGEVDEKGVRHIHPDARGCPYCGSTDAKTYDVDGETRAVFYHAAAECCVRRLDDQVRWRDQELRTLEAQLEEAYDRIRQLESSAEESYGQTKAALHRQAEKARDGMRFREDAVRTRMNAIVEERTSLAKKRGWMRKKEQGNPAAQRSLDERRYGS